MELKEGNQVVSETATLAILRVKSIRCETVDRIEIMHLQHQTVVVFADRGSPLGIGCRYHLQIFIVDSLSVLGRKRRGCNL